MRIYLAGGAVRDLLLGRTATDKDYLVFGAEPDEFMRTFPKARRVGKSFSVFILEGSEFVFPRGKTLESDLLHRDLTINAMLLGPDGELICHKNALQDLQNKVLRPASEESLLEDPLRTIRAARFSATFPDFTVLPELIDAMRETAQHGLLDGLPNDRIAREVIKALGSSRPGNFLRTLAKAGCLSPWFTEFEGADEIPAGPPKHHDSSVLEHTCRIMDACAGDELTVWMALCHDLGKTVTPKEELPRHIAHEKRGEALAERLALRLKMPNRYVLAGTIASRQHMNAARYGNMKPGSRVTLLEKARKGRCLRELFELAKADHGVDFREMAQNECAAIQSVRLPPEAQNLGEESGKRLHQLRAEKIMREL